MNKLNTPIMPLSIAEVKTNNQGSSCGKALKELVKAYADLLFDFDHQDITFRENAIALGELLINLGIDPVKVKEHWLGNHPLKQALVLPFNISTDYETIDGGIKWDEMIDDLETALISLGAKIDNESAIALLEKIEPLCQDGIELLKISERVKKLLYQKDFQNWQNTIKPFQKRLSDRIWDEKQGKSSENVDLKWERFINELKIIQQEPNTAKRQFLLSELSQKTGRSLSLISSIMLSLEEESVTPQKDEYSLDELLGMESDGQAWHVPGYLPQGELIILSAKPKVGKTLLATQLAKETLTGKSFLGESVRQGKVLYVTSDESIKSMARRLKACGFADIPQELRGNFTVLTSFDITNQSQLQAKCQEFKPDLVILDSLTSISRKSGISENDAEFARPIYQLRDLLASVNAAGILIHHDNKSKEAKGIDKMSGTGRIAAAWGIWQLSIDTQDSDRRRLDITPRETQASSHDLIINPKSQWDESGIYAYKGELGDESGEKRTASQQVLDILKEAGDRRLEAIEIKDKMGGYSNIYTVLSRLEDRELVSTDRCKSTGKKVYFISNCTTNSNSHENDQNIAYPPLLTLFPKILLVILKALQIKD
jgi:archaellum biogenesis ATPase FlaH